MEEQDFFGDQHHRTCGRFIGLPPIAVIRELRDEVRPSI